MNVPPRTFQLRNGRITVRVLLMLVILCSTLVGISPTAVSAQESSEISFSGAGWGHGVGLSQYGARNMGGQGMSHAEILAHYYEGTDLGTVTAPEGIRVHLADIFDVTLSSSGPMSFANINGAVAEVGAGGAVSISAHDGGLQIGPQIWVPVSPTQPVIVSFPNPVRVSATGHEYVWGKLQLTEVDGKVRVVEVALSMERYVEGIAEMPASWPAEALEAQAIAARTYAHYMTADRRADPEWEREFDIYGSTLDQNYEGYDARHVNWLKAVERTAYQELTYEGGRVKAYYSAANGGHTESSGYVFDLDLPYTPVKPDVYDAPNPWSQWTRSYSIDALSRHFSRTQDASVGLLTDLRIVGPISGSSRIDDAVVELVGTDGTKQINGRRMMVVINAGVFAEGGGLAEHLPSTLTKLGTAPINQAPPAQVQLADPATSSNSGGDVILSDQPLPAENAVTEHQPKARLDAFKAVGGGQVLIDGWAFDPDAPSEPLMIDVYLDTVRVGEFSATEERAGLGDLYAGSGDNHGFSINVGLDTAGLHQVCVVARDFGELSGISLGCVTVNAQEVNGQVGTAALSATTSP